MLRAGRGDRSSYAVLFERHRDRVRALARRMQCRDDETDDVAQEVLLRVWTAAPEWEPRARFETWLRRVTVNVCLDRVARKREVPCDAIPEIADLTQEPSRHTYVNQIRRHLRRALAGLPDAQRTALVLCHYRGRQQREVATLMGLSPAALESLVARARRAMRLRLRHLERERDGRSTRPLPDGDGATHEAPRLEDVAAQRRMRNIASG